MVRSVLDNITSPSLFFLIGLVIFGSIGLVAGLVDFTTVSLKTSHIIAEPTNNVYTDTIQNVGTYTPINTIMRAIENR
jgi:hypothetical protein